MAVRIHIVVDEQERDAFRARAAAEGRSLSEWLREAARARLLATSARQLKDEDALESFFAACDQREQEAEPEWAEHLKVIDSSRALGIPSP